MRNLAMSFAVLACTSALAAPLTLDFTTETVGAEPRGVAAAIGHWLVMKDGDKTVLAVDGRKWSEGQAAPGLADKARALYGERYGEFLDNVQAYAYFPLAVVKDVEDFREGTITLRFKGLEGRVDQAAGIVFNLKANGDYLVLRANCLEDNLVLFKYQKGHRSSVKWIRNTPTPSKQWHDMKLTVKGLQVTGYLDGKPYLEHTLPESVSGRVGLWSKADSFVYMDDVKIEPAGR